MKRYDLSRIMSRAWQIFRKAQAVGKAIGFGEALHRSWLSEKAKPINAQRVLAAKRAAGIADDVECDTWSTWRSRGFEVAHGSKAVFKAILIHGSKGDGASYTASFFSREQVQPLAG